MDKMYIGSFIIGLALAYGLFTFCLMFVSNTSLHDQILYGMLPCVILAICGVIIHVICTIKSERQSFAEVEHE